MGNINWNPSQFSHSSHTWLGTENPNVLISAQTGVQAHFIQVNQLTAQDINCYTLRAINSDCLVNVLAIIDNKHLNNSFRCQKSQGYRVIIQKIQYRLCDLGVMTIEDGLYVLRQGVRAIKVLTKLFDGFVLQEQAIGINKNGQCKYWVNCNYFLNTVEKSSNQSQQQSQQGFTQIHQQQHLYEQSNNDLNDNSPINININKTNNNKSRMLQSQFHESNYIENNSQPNCCMSKHYLSKTNSNNFHKKDMKNKDKNRSKLKNESYNGNETYKMKCLKQCEKQSTNASSNSQKNMPNSNKILQKLLKMIQNRMLINLTSSQLAKYKKLKKKYLTSQKAEKIKQKSSSNSNKKTNNSILHKYSYNQQNNQQSQHQSDGHTFSYTIQNMQILIKNLCKIFNITEQYRIGIADSTQNVDVLNTINNINSQLTYNINTIHNTNNRKSKMSLNKAKCISSLNSSKSLIKLDNMSRYNDSIKNANALNSRLNTYAVKNNGYKKDVNRDDNEQKSRQYQRKEKKNLNNKCFYINKPDQSRIKKIRQQYKVEDNSRVMKNNVQKEKISNLNINIESGNRNKGHITYILKQDSNLFDNPQQNSRINLKNNKQDIHNLNRPEMNNGYKHENRYSQLSIKSTNSNINKHSENSTNMNTISNTNVNSPISKTNNIENNSKYANMNSKLLANKSNNNLFHQLYINNVNINSDNKNYHSNNNNKSNINIMKDKQLIPPNIYINNNSNNHDNIDSANYISNRNSSQNYKKADIWSGYANQYKPGSKTNITFNANIPDCLNNISVNPVNKNYNQNINAQKNLPPNIQTKSYFDHSSNFMFVERTGLICNNKFYI